MKTDLTAIDQLPGVHRVENCDKEQMTSLAMEIDRKSTRLNSSH